MENAIHGIFLILGLITVGCVLLITIYLVISGIPAIRKIGVLGATKEDRIILLF
jgi:phosphate transport system permease protein